MASKVKQGTRLSDNRSIGEEHLRGGGGGGGWRLKRRHFDHYILNQLYVSVLLAFIPFSESLFTPAHSSWIFFPR